MKPDQGITLKSGFTTGTAAAAATKGALLLLVKNQAPDHVYVRFLTGEKIRIQMHTCTRVGAQSARCSVIKDAGDDPDVTHKAEIGALVTYPVNNATESVVITGGKGVGRVTKPGLGIPVGEPAITAGPRKMIVQSVEEVVQQYGIRGGVITELFVPQGEILAQKTLNARLGIWGEFPYLGPPELCGPCRMRPILPPSMQPFRLPGLRALSR
jgi:cobalt-precorrin-5B (C1)-methyltransferase